MSARAAKRVTGTRAPGPGRRKAGPLLLVQAFSLLAAIALVSAGCKREEIVYVNSEEHAADGTAAYTPLSRSGEPRVHANGEHAPAEAVQSGPADKDGGDL